jgi:excisionase family DNA binding protein
MALQAHILALPRHRGRTVPGSVPGAKNSGLRPQEVVSCPSQGQAAERSATQRTLRSRPTAMRIERDALYTIDDLAEMFEIGKRTAQRLIYTGKLPARKLGNKLVIRGQDLLDSLPPYTPRNTRSER